MKLAGVTHPRDGGRHAFAGMKPDLPTGSTLRAVFSRVTLHWGFAVRVLGASAAQPALAIAPPTTVVGSIAAALFRALGFRDPAEEPPRSSETRRTLSRHFECALRATLVASAGLTPGGISGLCVHQEPTRLVAAPYRTGSSWTTAVKSQFGSPDFYSKFLGEAMPVQATGATYGPGAQMDLLWVFDVRALTSCLLKSPGLAVEAGDVDKAGWAAAYGLTRLGSKEGLISVDQASYISEGIEVMLIGEIVRTHLYVPASCVEPVTRDVARINLWDLNYDFADYFAPSPASGTFTVPVPPERVPSYRLVSDRCAAYLVPGAIGAIGVGKAYGGEGRPLA